MQAHFGGQLQRYIVTDLVHKNGCTVCDKDRQPDHIAAEGITQLVVKCIPRQQKFIVTCAKVFYKLYAVVHKHM